MANQKEIQKRILGVLETVKVLNTKDLEYKVTGDHKEGSHGTFNKGLSNLKEGQKERQGRSEYLAWCPGNVSEVLVALAKNESELERYKSPQSQIEKKLFDQGSKMVDTILDWNRQLDIKEGEHHTKGKMLIASCCRLYALVLEVEKRKPIRFVRPWGEMKIDVNANSTNVGESRHSSPELSEWLIFYLGVVDELER